MKAGKHEKREYAFQAGVLGLDFAAEGPIGSAGGASYLANYRFSTLAILNELGLFPSDASATTFQDAAFKVHLPTAKNGYVSIWGLGGLSKDVFQVEGETFAYDYYSDRGVIGMNYRYYLNEQTYWETIVSFSADQQGEDYSDTEDEVIFRENYTNKALIAIGRVAMLTSYRLFPNRCSIELHVRKWLLPLLWICFLPIPDTDSGVPSA